MTEDIIIVGTVVDVETTVTETPTFENVKVET